MLHVRVAFSLINMKKKLLRDGKTKDSNIDFYKYVILEHLYSKLHYVKSVRIQSYSGPQFPTFGLNTEGYGVSLHIQSEAGKCGPE